MLAEQACVGRRSVVDDELWPPQLAVDEERQTEDVFEVSTITDPHALPTIWGCVL